MGLLNLDLKEGFDSLQEKLRNVFKEPVSGSEMRDAIARNDFPDGMEILEYQNGRPLRNERIILIGDMMPHQPFKFGGTQKIVKDYYAGNSEPTVQVLGSRESDLQIKGRLKSKKISAPAFIQSGGQQLREFAQEMQQQVDAMRIRGNLVRITMGEFQRFGFIESVEFNMKTLADIDYMVNFSIVGFNPPRDCKVLGGTKTVPVDINKTLIADVAAMQAERSVLPDGFNRSLGEQLKDAVSTVAGAVKNVTDFVDTVLDEVDDIRSALARAKGLILHARNTISQQAQRIGVFNPLNGQDSPSSIPAGVGIGQAYLAAEHIKATASDMFDLTNLLASMQDQLEALRQTEPLARHRVVSGDTLQRLANKFYNDSEQWIEIYDHNNLISTALEVGTILEIPRVDESG